MQALAYRDVHHTEPTALEVRSKLKPEADAVFVERAATALTVEPGASLTREMTREERRAALRAAAGLA